MPDSDDLRMRVLGTPNSQGTYLVGVVEFSSDSTEEQFSQAGNHANACLAKAAEELGFSRRSLIRERRLTNPRTATLPDGTRIAAFYVFVDERSGYCLAREPDDSERRHWALGLPGLGLPD